MQDSDGGVYCVVKPNTTAGDYYEHNLPCGTPSLDTCNLAPNDARRGRRIAWPKDTTCTAQVRSGLLLVVCVFIVDLLKLFGFDFVPRRPQKFSLHRSALIVRSGGNRGRESREAQRSAHT